MNPIMSYAQPRIRMSYYHVSIEKGATEEAAAAQAIMEARGRRRTWRVGQWTVKRIGQTPRRWAFRVRFQPQPKP